MSQTQHLPSSFAELLQSLSVEIAIFSISFLLALAFRVGPFRKTCDSCSEQKLGKPSDPKTERKNDVAHRKSSERPLVAHDLTGKPYATHALRHLIESTDNFQGTEAFALYLDARSNGQLDNLLILLKKNKQRSQDFFGHLVQSAARRERPECVVPLISDMIQLGLQRSLAFYESAMKTLASKKYYYEAMSVYKLLQADGLKPSPVTLSCLISFAVELGEPDLAISFFNQLAAVSTPSIRACMSILRVHSKRKDWAQSLAVVRDMQSRRIPIDSLVLNIVLATGVAAYQLEDAQKLLREFASICDVVSYNTLMKGFAQQKDDSSAVALLGAMRESHIKPNAITFNTVMDAAVRNSHVVEAWRVLARMRDAGLAPDKFTCTTLIKGLQNGATSEQLHAILDLLKTIDCDATLGSSLYHSVVDAAMELDDVVLTRRVVTQAREQKIPLAATDNQRLLQRFSLEMHNPSSKSRT